MNYKIFLLADMRKEFNHLGEEKFCSNGFEFKKRKIMF